MPAQAVERGTACARCVRRERAGRRELWTLRAEQVERWGWAPASAGPRAVAAAMWDSAQASARPRADPAAGALRGGRARGGAAMRHVRIELGQQWDSRALKRADDEQT